METPLAPSSQHSGSCSDHNGATHPRTLPRTLCWESSLWRPSPPPLDILIWPRPAVLRSGLHLPNVEKMFTLLVMDGEDGNLIGAVTSRAADLALTSPQPGLTTILPRRKLLEGTCTNAAPPWKTHRLANAASRAAFSRPIPPSSRASLRAWRQGCQPLRLPCAPPLSAYDDESRNQIIFTDDDDSPISLLVFLLI